MSDGIEAVGEAVTGGLAARTMEPEAGERYEHEQACLNCGADLVGPYCHACGQAGHVHRTLAAFWHDLAHGVLHFEGKIWRTLPLLAWRPGELTRRYLEGERARFVSPMAIFLFSVFLMFAVFSTVGGPFHINDNVQNRAESEREYRRDRAEALREIKKLEAGRARLQAEGKPTVGQDAGIRAARAALALEERLRRQELAAEQKREGSADKAEGDGGGSQLTIGRTGVPNIDKALEKAEKNPELLLYKLQNNAYKFSWALIPISVPFVWLLFLHRRRYWQYKAYDHTVFVTYSIAFMSLGVITLSLLRPLGLSEAIIGLLLTFVPPIHMYRQLRGAYRLSRLSAVWRTFMLASFSFVAAGLFLALLVVLGVLG